MDRREVISMSIYFTSKQFYIALIRESIIIEIKFEGNPKQSLASTFNPRRVPNLLTPDTSGDLTSLVLKLSNRLYTY